MDALAPDLRTEPALDEAPRRIEGRGTPEWQWRMSTALQARPLRDARTLLAGATRVVVVAPHPDDEILGTGGLLAACADPGAPPVLVVAVTDGEASHRGSAWWNEDRLAAERRAERRRGLVRLGLERATIDGLGLPDGGLQGRTDELTGLLEERLRPGDTVLATWRHDGHPDHEAVGAAAAAACAVRHARLLEVPVWMWHWARPDDPRVPWERLLRVPLGGAQRERKRAAIAAHATQCEGDPVAGVAPVLPPWVLERLTRPWEAVIA